MSDEPDQPKKPFLYVVVCAAGIAGDAGKLITAAQERHWDVGVVATPQALGFIDVQAVEAQTGYPILPQALNFVRAGETPLPGALPASLARCPRRMRSRSPRPPSTRSTSGQPGSPTPWPWASCVRRTASAFPPPSCRT